jgi:hypothetical protein
MRNILLILSFLLLLVAATPKPATTPRADWKVVEQAIGRAGTMQPGDVYKVSFPRGDLAVTLDGVAIKPALALGSWAAFKAIGGGHVMTMGDLVLLESEVTPVMDALQKGGIEQSALHNHLIGESPHVMYMHFDGHGDAAKLAHTLHDALALTKTPMGPMPAPPATPSPIGLPTADLDRIIGRAGKIAGGGIAVTALHSHMLEETPRLFFMHFWANDDAKKLATTLRAALDVMHVKK